MATVPLPRDDWLGAAVGNVDLLEGILLLVIFIIVNRALTWLFRR